MRQLAIFSWFLERRCYTIYKVQISGRQVLELFDLSDACQKVIRFLHELVGLVQDLAKHPF